MNLISEIKKRVQEAFDACGYKNADILTKVSDRPELSDYQSNGALPLAKSLKQNPRMIAEAVADYLKKDSFFKAVTVDGPGFINMSITDDILGKMAPTVFGQENLGYLRQSPRKKVVMDYGGPNIAKALHVGHLRPAIIGDAVNRILRFAGDEVISDVHLGDWGKPMGLLITMIQERQPDLVYFDPDYTGSYPKEPPFTGKDLEVMYPEASARSKEDPEFAQKAENNTKLLQDGHRGYRALWQQFVEVSVADIKEIYGELNVDFDLWRGESNVHDRLGQMVNRLSEKGTIVPDDGAKVIHLGKSKTGNDLPPLIMVKSNGGFMYGGTDLATVEERVEEFNPDNILYFTDARQGLHFEQVFKAAEIIGLTHKAKLEHLVFGTVNGTDNKPFKTRDGGIMTLRNLIDIAKNSALRKMEAGEMGRDLTAEEKKDISAVVGVSALKFFDLMNDRIKNYVFDEEKLSSLEGKTGPYCLYALVRMKSIFEKMGVSQELKQDDIITITNPAERQLLLRLHSLPEAVQTAYDSRAPHVIADYLFKIAQDFNFFYHDCPIKDASEDIQKSRLALVKCALIVGLKMADLLGLRVPNKM